SELYMVTGVQIARGVRDLEARKSDSTTLSTMGRGGATDSSHLIGANIGGDLRRDICSSQTITAKTTSDFVSAYRLHRIRYRLRVSLRPYADGEIAAI